MSNLSIKARATLLVSIFVLRLINLINVGLSESLEFIIIIGSLGSNSNNVILSKYSSKIRHYCYHQQNKFKNLKIDNSTMYAVKPYISPFDIKFSDIMYNLPNIYGDKKLNQSSKIDQLLKLMNDILIKQNKLIETVIPHCDNSLYQMVIKINPLSVKQNFYMLLFMSYLNPNIKFIRYVHSLAEMQSLTKYIKLCEYFHKESHNIKLILTNFNQCTLHQDYITIYDSVLISKLLWELYIEKNEQNKSLQSSVKMDLAFDIFTRYEKSEYLKNRNHIFTHGIDEIADEDVLQTLLENDIIPPGIVTSPAINKTNTFQNPLSLFNDHADSEIRLGTTDEQHFTFFDIFIWCHIFNLRLSSSSLSRLLLLEPSFYLWDTWFEACCKVEPFARFLKLIHELDDGF